MKKVFIALLVHLSVIQGSFSQEKVWSETELEKQERMAWWSNAKFGMFLHWGVYSAFGGEWNGIDYGKEMGAGSAEWIYLLADIPKEAYEKKAQQFNPVNYKPAEWVKMAKDAGMKYMVLTTKHHDGFAMFDTKASDWNVVKSSAYKKDLLKEYIDECHKQGMRVGIYYSHEKDWYHYKKVRRNAAVVPEDYKKIVKTHLEELLTNYGQIDLIWFDMGVKRHADLNQMCYDLVRKYQPNCVVSSRIGNNLGDYENLGDRELASPGAEGYLESIMTLRHNWGYDKNDSNWKPSEEVISMLSKCACRNSNFLLNIGPGPDGCFTPEETARLKDIAKWTKVNGKSIYETKGSPFKGEYKWGSITTKEKKVYLHLFGDENKTININGIKSKVNKAYVLGNNTPVLFTQNTDKATITATIPKDTFNQTLPVVVLELNGDLEIDLAKGPTWIPPSIHHTKRKETSGILVESDGVNFMLNDNKKQHSFSLNEQIQYRINDHGNIQIIPAFMLIKDNRYKVVSTRGNISVVEIITLMK
ncbi:alpha-L-fucosidase [Polaribacter sp. Asnod6-C07]|uniref:alpha-L-fucosidase n=1 Tax=Polaribacter sp. Asnod6-C07 TaxID=3160582 RepID=UPI00386D3AB4